MDLHWYLAAVGPAFMNDIALALHSNYLDALQAWRFAHGYYPCTTLGRSEDCEQCEQLVRRKSAIKWL